MKRHTIQKLYIDTNVLINYCTGQAKEREALEYLFRTRRKEVLFTSSLALVQTITNLQTKKKARKAYSKEETTKLIGSLFPKLTVLDLTFADVTKGSTFPNADIEDSIHYVLSQKHKCGAIVTNNVSDFIYFRDIEVLKPEKRLLSLRVR